MMCPKNLTPPPPTGSPHPDHQLFLFYLFLDSILFKTYWVCSLVCLALHHIWEIGPHERVTHCRCCGVCVRAGHLHGVLAAVWIGTW